MIMKTTQLVALVALLATPAVLATSEPSAQRRHHAQLVARQAMGSNQTFGDPVAESASAEVPISSAASVSVSIVPSSSAVESVAESSIADIPSSSAVPSSSAISSAVESFSSAVEQITSSSVAPIPSSTFSAEPESSAVTSAASSASDVASSIAVTTVISTASGRVPSLVSASRSASPSASIGASSGDEKKSSGLSKGALAAIIVVASVVGIVAIGWTLFRKWKLRPSNRFDERLQPIDFSPTHGDLPDPFLEKTRHRPSSINSNDSASSADRQRQQFVSELDAVPSYPPAVPGVPVHDFVADPAHGYADLQRGQQAPHGYYDYEQPQQPLADGYDYGHGHAQYPPQPQAYHQQHPQDGYQQDGYQQDGYQQDGYQQDGYHQAAYHQDGYHQDGYDYAAPGLQTEPSLGRPTGGHEGPYAQAAQYRAY